MIFGRAEGFCGIIYIVYIYRWTAIGHGWYGGYESAGRGARFKWRGLRLELFDIKEKRREIVLDLKRISLWNCSND